MSTTRHTYASLEPPTAPAPIDEQLADRDLDHGAADPTETKTIARRYASDLRGRLGKINAVLRDAIRSDDVLGLRDAGPAAELLAYDPVDPPDAAQRSPARTVRSLTSWLDGELERGVLAVADGRNQYIRAAYDRGLRHADRDLPSSSIEQLAESPPAHRDEIHVEAIEALEVRNREELRGVTDELSREASRELLDAIERGASPTAAAAAISDRFDKVGKHRVSVLARTEVPRAHNAAVIRRVEQARGPDGRLRLVAETAGDRRMCPECAAREGEVRPAREWRGDKPPWHPHCRCALRPDT